MAWSATVRRAAAQDAASADDAPSPTSAPASAEAASAGDGATSQPATWTESLSDESAPRGPWLTLRELKFDFGFESELSRRQVNSDYRANRRGDWRQTDEVRRFEETIGLDAAGALFDERIATFDIFGRGGLSQETYSEVRPGPDREGSPNGSVLEYDARLTFFPAGRISSNVFASQLEDRIPRPFLPSLDRERERYGADLVYSDRVLPMRLSFESLGETQDAPADRDLDDAERDEQRLHYEATWQPDDRQTLRFDYEYSDERDRYAGTRQSFDTIRNDVNLTHTLLFGHDQRSRLETFARFQDETGDLARDLYEFAPQLRLQHGDQFSTYYKAQLLSDSYDGLSLRTQRGDAGFTLEWPKSVFSTVGLYALRSDAEGSGDTAEWGGLFNTSLQRENSLGRFSAHFDYTHSVLRTDSDDETFGTIVSEAATFRDPLPVILSQDAIELSSLIVSDSSRRLVYVRGIDYLAAQSRGVTRLWRVRNGRIADGQSVYVSYRYDATRKLDRSTDRIDFRVQQDFKGGWTPYYATSLQHETLDQERFSAIEPRDINRHRLGLRYRRERWSASGEYEYNDDSIDPYQALHTDADWTLLWKPPHALDARAAYSYYDFDGEQDLDPRRTHQLDLGLDYRLDLGLEREASLGALYRYEDDSIFGRTEGVDLNAAVKWRIGEFWASVEVEYDLLDLPRSRDQGVAAWFKIRREFPVIRPE